MLKHPELTLRRIESFLNETLRPQLWRSETPLQAAVFQPEPRVRDYRADAIAPEEAGSFVYTPVEPGFAWGPVWGDAWFRFTGEIPAEWAGKAVAARLDCGAEAIVWEGDDPVQGIDANHGEFLLTTAAEGGAQISLTVQATGMNPNVSVHGAPKPPPSTPFTFRQATLALYDPALFGLYYDLKVALGVLKEQPKDTPRFGQLLSGLNEAVGLCAVDDPGSIAACRKRIADCFDKPASASAHRISAVGHSHIDAAWLWPLERTQFKCLHTFATVLRLMDQYPEFRFVCSQPALYAWVKRLSPALYARIKAKIAAGQWEVTGSMWVEPDCNLSSGESLVRQILHGKNFFMDEFDVETHDLWLPDVFGYAASLPQILKRARIDYFMTQKMSWNQVNKFPHHTFLWKGIDGTQIFTHFLPSDTPNGDMSPRELAHSSRNFRDHDRTTRSLYLFGHGDGGGGPTAEMIENARRLANVEGMPTVIIEPANTFFWQAEAEARDLAVWVGELYLELHRGTYTTQAKNKRSNRKAEFALRDAEFLSVISPAGLVDYPLEALDRLWKTVLLNQFHDIIPGSSIAEVYRDSAEDYAVVAEDTAAIITEATEALAAGVNTRGVKRPVLVVSNLSHFANEAVSVPLRAAEKPITAIGPEGDAVAVQVVTDATGGRSALFVAKNAPLHGYAVWDLNATTVPVDEDEDAVSASTDHLENDSLRVEFDPATGLITRLFDKDNEREILHESYTVRPNGKRDVNILNCANQLILHEDKPLFWDAWDVDIYTFERGNVLTDLTSVTVVEDGPVRGAIRFERTFGKSRIVQTVRLTTGSMRLDFVTEVDWQEIDTMLKVAFPVAINSARATYEIQYGHVERPTHTNTSWDQARFEVCAQKWADLSEGNYGVALLNDCKYGHDIQGHTLRLTLLRSPQAPDPTADRGTHQFTYSLLPHNGDFREGEVVENAYALNSPPVASALPANRPGPLPLERSFFEVDNAAVFIEVIKRAEKENAVIVRLYEVHNTRGSVTLTTTLPVKSAWYCDLMEKSLAEIPLSGNEMLLPIQPFEIVTIKLLL
jgi:alpha-mannosidase